jgi:hypothetical protein
VFQTLLDNKLFIKFSKCTFVEQHISYLGILGVATDPTKTEAMMQWPVL